MTPQELKAEREAAGMSHQELADALRCARRTIQRMEMGKFKISFRDELAIRQVFQARCILVAGTAPKSDKS